MSEVQSRSSAPRGRGSGRGGRGGYSSRGSRPRQANGEKADANPAASYEDEGEIGELKRQYSSKLMTIKEMFPDWTDEDIVFALHETGGDLESTIDRISEGNVSQWGEVKKKTKDRARSKVKEPAGEAPNTDSTTSGRTGRGRGFEGTRGGRGRGSERGRGASRARGGLTGPRKSAAGDAAPTASTQPEIDGPLDAPAEAIGESAIVDGADQPSQGGTASPDASWEIVTPSEAAPLPAAESQKPSLRPDGTRSWASMLKPVPKPRVTPSKAQTQPPSQAPVTVEEPAPSEETVEQPEVPTINEEPVAEDPALSMTPPMPPSEPATNITPSKDKLTESNVEQVEDVSQPIPTLSVVSNKGTDDPRSGAGSITPFNASQQPATALRPGLGGFATSALKATIGSNRSTSFQRRLKEQQEAVVMPGNHAMDRATVQFGSMGLNGNLEELDVDDEREEPETRTQPPQHSPVAPRASLPPAPQQATTEPQPATRMAPGLPSVGSQQVQNPQVEQTNTQPAPQSTYGYNQFNNLYGASAGQGEATTPAAKPYEPFGQQAQQPSSQQQYDAYSAQSQGPSQHGQSAPHSQLGGFSSAANDYSSYYTSDNQRANYQNYYGSYGQQTQQQDASLPQQRATSAFGASGAEQPSLHSTSQGQQQPQGRYGANADAQNSGHSTPNPVAVGQQAHSQSHGHQSHQMGQNHAQAAGHHGYPYAGTPYYSPYYQNYMNQFGYGGTQGGYGSTPYGAAGKYNQPHQYGMSPQQSSYDPHSAASPANVGAYGQQPHSAVPGRDSAPALGAYGRSGSAQPSEGQQQHTSSSYSGMSDVFGRSQSGFPGQTSQQQGNQQTSNDDTTRTYGDASKATGGPSPAPGHATVRPGSAANNMPGQSGLPGTQSQSQQSQQSYGYPSQMGHQIHGQQSQYGSGLGGLGTHHQSGQGHQTSGYGSAYGAGFGGNYYANNSRGGWSGNYGQH